VDAKAQLTQLFEAERAARNLHRQLLAAPPGALLPLLVRALRDANGLEPEEAALRLVRIAPLLQGIHGPEPVDALIDMLGSELPEARLAAGEALQGVAFERLKEVALGVERALVRLPESNGALVELPYLLAEVGEGGVVRLLGKFLSAKSAEIVSAAIESLVELGDPTAVSLLEPLTGDVRSVQLDDEEEEVSIGALASEACEILLEEQ
jgi:HEAT repeat protein